MEWQKCSPWLNCSIGGSLISVHTVNLYVRIYGMCTTFLPRREKKAHWLDIPSHQSLSAHARCLNEAPCLVFKLKFSLGLTFKWANILYVLARLRGCAGSPEPLLFAYILTALFPSPTLRVITFSPFFIVIVSTSSFADMNSTQEDMALTNTTPFPYSDAEVTEKLQAFNDIQALRYFPVFVFVAIMMIVGTIGNILVLFVYCKRFRKTSSNYFIVAMAIFDLLACLIGMPTELYDLRHSYTFYSSTFCKIFRYTGSVTVYGSVFILIEIAIDRYFKICHPLKIIDIMKIKIMCIASGIVAVLVSIPTILLYGISKSATPDPFIYGHDCSIDEQYRKKTFSKVYYYLLGIIFVVALVLLSALYFRIWLEIRRRKSLVIGDQVTTCQHEDIPMTDQKTGHKSRKSRIKYLPSMSDDDTSDSRISTRMLVRPRLASIAEAVTRIRVSRTTVILFAVTVAFLISYLPSIVIMICRSVIKDLEEKQTLAEQILSKLFSKFYFINNAINPLIYSFLNNTFRKGCVKLLKQFLMCRRRKPVFFPALRERKESDKSSKSTRSSKEGMHVAATWDFFWQVQSRDVMRSPFRCLF